MGRGWWCSRQSLGRVGRSLGMGGWGWWGPGGGWVGVVGVKGWWVVVVGSKGGCGGGGTGQGMSG